MAGGKVRKSIAEIPTIDVNLVTVAVKDSEGNVDEFGFDTANKIAVEVQSETTDAVKLVVKGILRAQKQEETTITGNQITLTDNVFNPDLVMILQGGTIEKNEDGSIKSYAPPVAGSKDKGKTFTLCAYSAQYDASGSIVQYEKISYPNCKGVPVALNSEDGAFRAPEYIINSAPKTGEPPYRIDYVKELPELVEPADVITDSDSGSGTTKNKTTDANETV